MMLLLAFSSATLADQPSQSETSVVSDEDSLEVQAKLDLILNRVRIQQRELKTMRGDFRQTNRSQLLLAEEESTGRFSYRAPGAVRWDYSAPDPMTVVILNDEVTTYYPDLGSTKRAKISERQRRIVSMLVGAEDLGELLDQFRATLEDSNQPSTYLVVLQPNRGRLKKRVSRIEFHIDRDLFLPMVMEYHESNGNWLRFELSNVEINPMIDDGYFEIDVDGTDGKATVTR